MNRQKNDRSKGRKRVAAAALSLLLGLGLIAEGPALGLAEEAAGQSLLATDTIETTLRDGNQLGYNLPHQGDSETVRAEFTLVEVLVGGEEKEVSSWNVTGLLQGEVSMGSFGAWRLKALVTDGVLEEWAYSGVYTLSDERAARENEIRLEPDMPFGEGAFEGADVKAIRLYDGLEAIPERAFKSSSLQWIYIPASVTVFPDSAFEGCTAALIVCAPENSPAAMFAQEMGLSLEIAE